MKLILKIFFFANFLFISSGFAEELHKKQIKRSVGHWVTEDMTEETDQKIIEDAPNSSSNDRLAIMLQGTNPTIEAAVQTAGKIFAMNIHDTTLLVIKDNDSNPHTAFVSTHADGRDYNTFTLRDDMTHDDMVRAVFFSLQQAYGTHVAPFIIEEPEAPIKKGPPQEEGSGASSTKARPPPPAGKFVTSDVRDYTGEDLIDAPYSFSTGRIAVILYGENKHVKGAVEYAAQKFAEKTGIMVSYLWAKDNDENPNNSRVGFYGGAQKHGDLDIGIGRDQKEVAMAVFQNMSETYNKFRSDIIKQQEILTRQN